MKLKSLFIVLALFAVLFLLFAAVPVRAEGPATPEATPTPVIVSPAGQPMAVQIVSEVSVIVYLAIGALIGGSGVLAATLIVVRSVLNSPVLISTLENLAKSWPAPVRELTHDVGQLAAEITDDVPYTTKFPGTISGVKTYASALTPEQIAGLPEAKG
jgi:hypothetical protein